MIGLIFMNKTGNEGGTVDLAGEEGDNKFILAHAK